MSEQPNKFSDLDVKELRRSAVEDFAVEVGPEDSKKLVLAALTEAGVEWSDYVTQHPSAAPEDKAVEGVVDVVETPTPVKIRTQEPVASDPEEKFLVKMTRENPLFETCGYKFTSTHPYALVDAKHVEFILTKEEGFRQALPSEVQEYYG